MFEALLLSSILIIPVEPLGCDDEYETPPEIAKILKNEGGAVVEIREQSPTGYIESLFYNRSNDFIYLEGWFIQTANGGIAACEITEVRQIDKEGRVLFLWHRDQKET